jgi:hypothetical protein
MSEQRYAYGAPFPGASTCQSQMDVAPVYGAPSVDAEGRAESTEGEIARAVSMLSEELGISSAEALRELRAAGWDYEKAYMAIWMWGCT